MTMDENGAVKWCSVGQRRSAALSGVVRKHYVLQRFSAQKC
jgi:hypothetical protein